MNTMTEWTKEPPTEPGWYWWRDSIAQEIIHLRWDSNSDDLGYWEPGTMLFHPADRRGGKWWLEPIQPPMTDEKGEASDG